MANASSGTSSVTVEPAATFAPRPILTGAIRFTLEPMNAFAPITVLCFSLPS